MIVVVGEVGYEEREGHAPATGLATEVAAAAVARGRRVELVAKVGEDGAGDAVLLALSGLGIGHAAVLRDAARLTPVFVRRGDPEAEGEEEDESEGEREVEREGEPGATVDRLPAGAERPVLDRGDVELALGYLPDLHVVVLVAGEGVGEGVMEAAAEGAAFAGARLVVLARHSEVTDELDERAMAGQAIVLEAPEQDDGAFARLVGAFAASLDARRDPEPALRQAIAESGWERVAE